MYKDALRTLERNFGKPQEDVVAHLDKPSSFPPLEMHNRDNIFNYSGRITRYVGVFKPLSYDSDLKSAALLNAAVQQLPLNLKESWSLLAVRENLVKSNLLNFHDWLKEKADAHDLIENIATKTRNDNTKTQ